jgi:hypothetical protein
MIQALQDHFLQSCRATDEKSQAYCAVLKGVNTEACLNSQSHVAFRLLLMRFLDICKGLDKNIEMQSDDFTRNRPGSVLKLYNVCFTNHTSISGVMNTFVD